MKVLIEKDEKIMNMRRKSIQSVIVFVILVISGCGCVLVAGNDDQISNNDVIIEFPNNSPDFEYGFLENKLSYSLYWDSIIEYRDLNYDGNYEAGSDGKPIANYSFSELNFQSINQKTKLPQGIKEKKAFIAQATHNNHKFTLNISIGLLDESNRPLIGKFVINLKNWKFQNPSNRLMIGFEFFSDDYTTYISYYGNSRRDFFMMREIKISEGILGTGTSYKWINTTHFSSDKEDFLLSSSCGNYQENYEKVGIGDYMYLRYNYESFENEFQHTTDFDLTIRNTKRASFPTILPLTSLFLLSIVVVIVRKRGKKYL